MYRGANCGTFAKWVFKGMLKMRKALAYISVILFMLCLLGCSKVAINYNLHRRLHTNAYYTAVNVIITSAYGKGRTYWVRRAYVISALNSIKSILLVAGLGL